VCVIIQKTQTHNKPSPESIQGYNINTKQLHKKYIINILQIITSPSGQLAINKRPLYMTS